MKPSIEVVSSPPPPSGLPPPRPPGLHRDPLSLPERRRPGPQKSNVRSLSCDVPGLDGRAASKGDLEEETDSAAAGRPGGHNILVAVRCRRLLLQEAQAGGKAVIKITGSQTVVLEDPHTTAADDYLRINKSKERQYNFDQAFDQTAHNREVYERTTRFLIGSVLQGFNATVFAYGATSAGKTHTMLGYTGEPGIMLLTLQDLFNEVRQNQGEKIFEVKCSFLEVYNENIRDLLRPDGDFLDIREDPVKGMCVAGISEVEGLESADEIMALLQQANKHRTTESTGANVTSSRSHAVLQVMVHQRDKSADIVTQVNVGKLSMIDLAGSERASHTNNKGMRMIEGANINRSLLALGNCITALSSAVAFVPYRDSKMTRLLKDSLGGNCRTVMIANVSPCHINYEDTHNTLKYANRAKNIKTKAVRNVVRVNYHVSKYTDIIKDLRGEISELKAKLAEAPDTPRGLMPGGAENSSQMDPTGDEETEMDTEQSVKWKQELMQNFEDRVRIKRRLIDLAHLTKNQMVQKSHAQVGISQWESGRQVQSDDQGDSDAPPDIRELQEQLKYLKKELARTEETTRGLEEMLVENQEKAEKLQQELPRRVKNKDIRAFLGLISRIYVMEVENMDMQEMVDVTAPLLEQKELDAEALRLQIQLRDRVIEEQDELLQGEQQAALEKPEGWISVPAAKPSRRSHGSVRWSEEDDLGLEEQSPSRRRGYSGLNQRDPDVGIAGRGRIGRAASEGPPQTLRGLLPPLSPSQSDLSRPELPSARGLRPDRSRGGLHAGAGTPPTSASGSASAMENFEDAHRGRPLDVAGRGLGLPPRPSAEDREARRTPKGEESIEGDLDSTRLPYGQSPLGANGLTPEASRRPAAGISTSATRKRQGRKKNRRGDSAENRSQVQLQVEAAGLRRDLDESPGSGSEPDHGTKSPSPHPREKGDPALAPTPVSAAAERRGIISKLNKRLKSGQENAPAAKHLY